jgi:hypothetical protein
VSFQKCFNSRKSLLDGIEIWGIRREKEELAV